ncbi:MAG: hypothetical protein R2752_13295 [Vicinamibacterales bacterium]
MKKVQMGSLAVGVLVTVATATSVAAQSPPSPTLNTLEVERLASSNTPEAHARLGAHFAALAEQYASQARRHTSMSKRFLGNPSRNLGAGTSAHCRRLAELNTRSAETLGKLAAHHNALAAGAPSVSPPDSARFEMGAGAPAPTEEQLDALAATAGTPAEHGRLARYFLDARQPLFQRRDSHARMARAYRALPRGASAAAPHCDRLVSRLREAAKEASGAAALHRALADTVR